MILQNIGKNSDSVIIPVEKNIIPNTTVIMFRVTKNTVFLRCFLLTYFMILQNIGKNSDSVIIPVEKNIIPNTTVIIELTLIFF